MVSLRLCIITLRIHHVLIGLKGFSPYTLSQCHPSQLEHSSRVKIWAPYIDGDYSSPDYVPYGDCNGKVGYVYFIIPVLSHLPSTDLTIPSFSQCPNQLFTEADTFDSGK
jgi:hypothetical protein